MRPAAHQSGLKLNPLPGITTRWCWDKGESWLADDEEVRPLAGAGNGRLRRLAEGLTVWRQSPEFPHAVARAQKWLYLRNTADNRQ